MRGKEFVLDVIRTYFTVVTFINVVMLVLGTYFAPDYRFGYEGFAAPLIYGAVGTFPNIIMYSKRDLGTKELWVRKILQLIAIEISVLFVTFYDVDAVFQKTEVVVQVGISIFVIYVISTIIDGFQDYFSAKKMTEELLKFQKSVEAKDERMESVR